MANGFNISRGGGASGGKSFNIPKGRLSSSRPSLSVKNTLTMVSVSNRKLSTLVKAAKRTAVVTEVIDEEILFGSTTVLWGSTTVTFAD